MTTYTVMKIEGFANGAECPIAGMYLKTFDHEAKNGLGAGTFTHNPAEAMRFKNNVKALEFWRKSPRCKPIRLDGKPNRPLTASTVSLEKWSPIYQ